MIIVSPDWMHSWLLQVSYNQSRLTFTTLWTNSANDKIDIFLKKTGFWHFMQIVFNGDNLREMSKPGFWKKSEKYCKMSAESFTQSAKR